MILGVRASAFSPYVATAAASTSTIGSGPIRPSVQPGNYRPVAAGHSTWNQDNAITQGAAISMITHSSINTQGVHNCQGANSQYGHGTVDTPISSFGHHTPQTGYYAVAGPNQNAMQSNQGLLAIAGPSQALEQHVMDVAPAAVEVNSNVDDPSRPNFRQPLGHTSQSEHVRNLGDEYQGVPKPLCETEFAIPVKPTESCGNELLYPLKDRKLGNPDFVSLCDRKRYAYGNTADVFPGEVCFPSMYGEVLLD